MLGWFRADAERASCSKRLRRSASSGELRRQHLDRDLAAQARVPCAIHLSHPARARGARRFRRDRGVCLLRVSSVAAEDSNQIDLESRAFLEGEPMKVARWVGLLPSACLGRVRGAARAHRRQGRALDRPASGNGRAERRHRHRGRQGQGRRGLGRRSRRREGHRPVRLYRASRTHRLPHAPRRRLRATPIPSRS